MCVKEHFVGPIIFLKNETQREQLGGGGWAYLVPVWPLVGTFDSTVCCFINAFCRNLRCLKIIALTSWGGARSVESGKALNLHQITKAFQSKKPVQMSSLGAGTVDAHSVEALRAAGEAPQAWRQWESCPSQDIMWLCKHAYFINYFKQYTEYCFYNCVSISGYIFNMVRKSIFKSFIFRRIHVQSLSNWLIERADKI